MVKKTLIILLLLLASAAGYLFWRYYATMETQRSAPQPEQATRMVLDTTLTFAKAVQARDLSLFRASTAEAFRKQYSSEQFEQAFGGYIQQGINLLPVARTQPVFTQPVKVDDNGVLTLKGYFPTRPSRVYFDYNYLWERNQWRLGGITLDVRPLNDDG